jgi:hypothetical protein
LDPGRDDRSIQGSRGVRRGDEEIRLVAAPVGALHRAGDWYVVRQLLPLEGLTWATLGRVIAAMTAWADVARPRPPRDVDVCRLFASFSA